MRGHAEHHAPIIPLDAVCEHVFVVVACALIPRFASSPRVGRAAGAARPSRSRWRPSRAGRRWSARSRARPRRSGSRRGCGSPRRSAAAPRWPWSRPTRRAPRRRGSGAGGSSRGSAPRSSPSAPGRGVLRPRRPARRSGGRPERALERARRRGSAAAARASGAGPDPALRPRGGAALAPPAGRAGDRRRRAAHGAVVPRAAAGGILRDRLGDEWTGVEPRRHARAAGRAARSASSAALPDSAVADRFGTAGMRALRDGARRRGAAAARARPRGASRGARSCPRPRSGGQLERALELLVDRLLATRERRGRSLRRLRLEARLAGGGGWRIEAVLRNASADRERLLLALRPKLAALPAPGLAPRAASARARRRRAPPAGAHPLRARAAPRADRRGGAPRARGRRARTRVLRVLEVDPRLERAGAARDPDALPRGPVVSRDRRRVTVSRALYAASRRVRPTSAAGRWRSAGSRSRRCGRSGWSRTAGGRERPIAPPLLRARAGRRALRGRLSRATRGAGSQQRA